MTDQEIEALGLEWAGPRCYLCEQPIRAGQRAVEVEVTDDDGALGVVDVHRDCLDATDIPVVRGGTY